MAVCAVALLSVLAIIVSLQLTDRALPLPACRTVALQVISSTEKSALLSRLAARYNASRPAALPGVCPAVNVKELSSGTAERALAAGWSSSPTLTGDVPAPEVWAPTSSMWLALLRTEKPDAGPAPQPAGEPYPVLARSAIVVAMPRDKAAALRKALDADARPFDWSALQLSTNASGTAQAWGSSGTPLRYGSPAWGRFLFRKDSPLDSTSGLAETVAMYDAAYGQATGGPFQGPDLPEAAFMNQAVTQFVRRAEAGIPPAGYSPDGTQMMRDLAADDQRTPGWSDTSAVVVQEQLAYSYNTNRLHGNAPDRRPIPLVPLYPASGTLMMDHPYVIMDGLPAQRRTVAEDFLRYLTADEQREAFADEGFRDVSGHPSAQLRKELAGAEQAPKTILAPTGAGIQAIQRSWRSLRKRANIVMLIDVSLSMQEPTRGGLTRLEAAQNAANAAVERSLNVGDRVELRSFSGVAGQRPEDTFDRPYPLNDVGDKQGLENAIRNLRPKADTPLYANIRLAHRYLRDHADPEAINAVIVLTDGADDYRHEPVGDLIRDISGSSVPVYCIAFGSDPKLKQSLPDLARIASETGGQQFDATDGGDTIDNAFAKALSVA